MEVILTFDDHEWQEFVQAWQEPAVRKTLGAAASAFGRAAKPIVASEIPVARPGNAYAKGPGNLRGQVKAHRIKRQGVIGVVIAPMGKSAYYRGWVARGTKAHIILPKSTGGRLAILGGFASAVHHPGAKPNDFIGRAADRAESAGYAKAEIVIFDGLEAKRVSETLADI